MPLDTYVDDPALFHGHSGRCGNHAPIVSEFQGVIDRIADNPARIRPLERFAFYERARTAFAIAATDERRAYGNLILKKGVVAPA